MKFIKDAVLGSLSFLGLPRDRGVILMYHSISKRKDYFSSTLPEDFAAQVEYLARSGRPVIALSEIIRRLRAGEPLRGAVAITFDDGYRDNYTAAFPVLQRYSLPATIFITTGLIGQHDERDMVMLSEDEIRTMGDSGLIEFGPHTKSHPKLARVSAEDARREILESKQVLDAITGKSSRGFAYPFGSYTDETVKIVFDLGFEGAVSVREGTVAAVSDMFRLPRVSIDQSTSFAQFRGKISRAIDVYEWLKSVI
jgi:peptidoglycan/xylan/chitin deacetylase (PgdA/CDA1 family)